MLLSELRELCLPGVRSLKLSGNNLVEDRLLLRAARLRVHEEEGILELDIKVRAVVLGELIFVKAVEYALEAFLDLSRELAQLLDAIAVSIAELVAHQKLHDLVGTKHGLLDGTLHQ